MTYGCCLQHHIYDCISATMLYLDCTAVFTRQIAASFTKRMRHKMTSEPPQHLKAPLLLVHMNALLISAIAGSCSCEQTLCPHSAGNLSTYSNYGTLHDYQFCVSRGDSHLCSFSLSNLTAYSVRLVHLHSVYVLLQNGSQFMLRRHSFVFRLKEQHLLANNTYDGIRHSTEA